MWLHKGACHCGAVAIDLQSDRAPREHVLGACQCSFCRKHNARTFSDPEARAILTAREPEQLQLYGFGLKTAVAVVCRRCGVYVGMVLEDGVDAWSTISVDALEDHALFTREASPRDYSAESEDGRIARRKVRWIPTSLIDWPAA